MANITRTDKDERLESIVCDAGGELQGLRSELGRYKVIFDSARLIVGHEFRKPLMAINGYVELLQNDLRRNLGDKDRRYFDKIKDAVDHMSDLIESFIQMLRLEGGEGNGQDVERVNLFQLVENIKERIGEAADVVENAIDRDFPGLLFRRGSIEVVLENLISNAVRYGGERGPVTVTASFARERRGTARENLLMVRVQDHGQGIPEDKLEDIFDPFYKLEYGGDSSGLGLGLALVKSIITIMKGEIHINSKPGAGTTATFTIPVNGEKDVIPKRIG